MTNTLIQWAIRLLGGITKDQWSAALRFVTSAAARQLTSEQKRAEVLSLLSKIGISGSRANWLVEASVAWLKRIGGLES